MTLREISVPDHVTYDFGVGVDGLSGIAMDRVVQPNPSSPKNLGGATQTFDVSRVSTTQELQQKLGIDVNASYGCASFGAGVSASFSFAQDSQVHAETLFMAISATVHFANQSIDDCILTQGASQVVDHPDIFTARYGDMFIRACQSGGIFVGLMRVEAFGSTLATEIEGELKGSYGLFSADAKVKFSNIEKKYNVNVYCRIYAEGGPPIQITNPNDPTDLLAQANAWMEGIFSNQQQSARPYQWTFSPISIAEGPLPLNQADIEHAHDILVFCMQERATLLDQLNQLNWWTQHQDKYDWTGSATPEQIVEAAHATQSDLDTVAACASAAIDTPRGALMPADYAAAQVPAKKYPSSQPAPKGPKPLPGTIAVSQVQIPDVSSMTVANAKQTLQQLGLVVFTQQEAVSKFWEQMHGNAISAIIGTIPDAGTMVNPNSSVTIRVPGAIQ